MSRKLILGRRALVTCPLAPRTESYEALWQFRVPTVYLSSAFLSLFSVLVFHRINKLRSITFPEGSNPTRASNF